MLKKARGTTTTGTEPRGGSRTTLSTLYKATSAQDHIGISDFYVSRARYTWNARVSDSVGFGLGIGYGAHRLSLPTVVSVMSSL